MHGRKRSEYKSRLSDPKLSAGLEQKAQQWNTLSQKIVKLKGQATNDDNSQTLELIAKLLQVNPDPTYLWNVRRDLLNEELDIETELTLTHACLERNPKSYGAWFHRKWSIQQHILADESLDILEKELQLVAALLKYDERNFHCWNYRRFVVSAMAYCKRIHGENDHLALDGSWNWKCTNDTFRETGNLMGPQLATSTPASHLKLVRSDMDALLKQEWDFSNGKIQDNFSNGSAFHYKSKLLPLLMKDSPDIIQEELELVHNAVFTEPDDQTPWWYMRFLLLTYRGSCPHDEYAKTLQAEVDVVQELIDTEEGKCKWGLLALHFMYGQLESMDSGQDHLANANMCLERVALLDPDRAGRYQSLRRL